MDTTRKRRAGAIVRVLMAVVLALGMMPALQVASPPKPAYAVENESENLDIVGYIEENADNAMAPMDNLKSTGQSPPAVDREKLVESGHYLYVNYLYVDESMVEPGDTMDKVWLERDGLPVLGQTHSATPLYDAGGDYYVAFANDTVKTTGAAALDSSFTEKNLNGVVIEGCVHDAETGISYIPKSVYKNDAGEEIWFGVNNQLMIPYDIKAEPEADVAVEIENGNPDVTATAKNQVVSQGAFDMTITVPVATPDTASNISLNDIEVTLNDAEKGNYGELQEGENAHWDEQTGELTLMGAAVSTAKVNVKVKERDMVLRATGVKTANAAPVDDIATLPWWTFDELDLSAINVGDIFSYYGSYNTLFRPEAPAAEIVEQAHAATAPYGYSWGNNTRNTAIERGQTYALCDWILGGNTFTPDEIMEEALDWGTLNTDVFGEDAGYIIDLYPSAGHDYEPNTVSWHLKANPGAPEYPGVASFCGHNTENLGNPKYDVANNGWNYSGTIHMRVLAKGDNYVVLGFQSPYVYSQAGSSIYKFAVDDAKGSLKVKKASANSNMTNNNSQYSLQGAVFQLLSGNTVVAEATVGSDGYANFNNIEKGTYTLREKTAPTGYLKAADVTVEVKAKETVEITVNDTPRNDPTAVRVLKKDANGSGPQGDAGVASAEITFRYYDGQYNASNLPSTPTRTWVMKTDADGYATISNGNSMKVSGDEFYYNNNGDIVIPLGTITAVETKAPAGYNLDDGAGGAPKLWVTNIVSDNSAASGARRVPVNYNTANIENSDTVIRGNVSGVKHDAHSANGAVQGDGSLAGCEIQVINRSTNKVKSPQTGQDVAPGAVVCTLKTDANGAFSTNNPSVNGWAIPNDFNGGALAYGTYELKETKCSVGYLLNGGWSQTVQIREQGQNISSVKLPETVIRGNVSGKKFDVHSAGGVEQGDGSLAGAEIQLINRSANAVQSPESGAMVAPGAVVCTLKTDANGAFSTNNPSVNGWAIPNDFNGGALAYGTYELRESKSSEGYLVNDGWSKTVEIREQGKTISGVELPETVKRGNVEGFKIDSATLDKKEQGAAKLSGAKVVVINRSAKAVLSPEDGTMVAPGSVVCTLITDENGKFSTSAAEVNGWAIPNEWSGKALAYGTYELRESARSEGYLLNKDWTVTVEVREDGKVYNLESELPEDVYRGDFEFTKADAQSQKRLAHVPFKVTSKTTGESHIIVTDANGFVSTTNAFNAHSEKTNANDAAVTAEEVDGKTVYTVDESKLDDTAGLWFSGHNNDQGAPVNDELGALPYDVYEIEELQVAANADLKLVKIELSLYRNNYTIDYGTVDDQPEPMLQTTLTGEDGIHVAPADSIVKLTDTIDYMRLEPGEYTFKGELHVISADGTDKGAVSFGTKVENVRVSNGTVEMDFSASTSALEPGDKFVAFEYCYDKEETLVASHAEPSDPNQTVTVPEVATTASDLADGDKELPSTGQVTLKDEVQYSGLEPDKEYTLTLTVHMVGENGEDAGEAKDASGNPVKAEHKFTPAESSGTETVTVVFTPDNGGYAAVAFEELSYNGNKYAVHADITDKSQTVTIPSIATTAKDALSGTHTAIMGENVSITDTVAYKQLTPGVKYIMKGELHKRAADGTDLGIAKDAQGNDAVARGEFTPEEANGTFQLEFASMAPLAAGETVVVFETLYREGNEETPVADHKEINDEGQSVAAAKLRTTATEKASGTHEAYANGPFTIVDTVDYTGLTPGVEYTMNGTVHGVSADGADLGVVKNSKGEDAAASVKFTPEKPSGKVALEIEVDPASMGEASHLVVFEKATTTVNGEEKPVGEHSDVNDTDQSIYPGKLRTTATGKDTGTHEISASGAAIVVDTVDYTGLTPGVEYTMNGTVHGVSADGKDLGVVKNTKGEDAAASVKFTPAQSAGQVVLEIEVDPASMGEADHLVVFEVATRAPNEGEEGDKPVADHQDPLDEGQSIYLSAPKLRTTATGKDTGTHEISASGAAIVVDTVDYTGLTPGVEYTMNGTVHAVSKDGEDLGVVKNSKGENAAASVKFTPAQSAGQVVLEIEVDPASMGEAHHLVVFEEATRPDNGGKEIPVASHVDPRDEAQSVYPVASKINTTATDKATGKHEGTGTTKATIVDKVDYTGLTPGKEYKLTGKLMDKATGKEIMESGKPVTSEVTFKPEKADGSVNVEFNLNKTVLNGLEAVVFERVLDADGKVVAIHEDINSASQTVKYGSKSLAATGSSGSAFDKAGYWLGNNPWVFALVGLGLVIGGVYLYTSKKKKAGSEGEEAAE